MDETAGIYGRYVEALDRNVQIGIAQGRVLSVDFPASVDDAEPDHELLDRIEAYLGGETEEFTDVQVAMTMPTDRREILSAVREIPYGEGATVEQLTRMVPGRDPDDADDLTAVSDALSENPAPIFVPTHRVRDGPDGMPSDVAAALRAVEGV
jgi:methylated-DNA-[protein]-cysteine S-methyltransferase